MSPRFRCGWIQDQPPAIQRVFVLRDAGQFRHTRTAPQVRREDIVGTDGRGQAGQPRLLAFLFYLFSVIVVVGVVVAAVLLRSSDGSDRDGGGGNIGH